ncbi:uncharacterized protein LOC121759091 isoform X2 [Salvia splendens]|uniref:uncharacterized protein LOC121759091 isoform X2 n=1 Tax=Salvia splendens TaxID=180675 RepID=UPI001C25CAAD|nr:uncharacterized protein LOC121759091 isoform X2 [Salvia splendens]
MNKKAKQQNRFVRIITTPYRALRKARDFYVRNMLDCANSNAIGLQSSGQSGPALPRSFSTSSSASRDDDADFRELVRARTIGVENLDAYIKQERKAKHGPPRVLPPRSASVAMGRIDEEKPSGFFGEDIKIVGSPYDVAVQWEVRMTRQKVFLRILRRIPPGAPCHCLCS